jgi:DNA-directed RNA polymerase specialized sigma24 family protein
MDKIRIQELMVAYRQNPTGETFEHLLREVDPPLEVCIRVLRSKCRILVIEDPQDLYQCAIIGLSNACRSITVEHDASRVDTRIFLYVKELVYGCYLRPHRNKYKLHKLAKLETCDTTPVWSKLLFADFEQAVRQLIARSVISYRDYQMFVQHFAYKRTYQDICKEFKLNSFTVRDHILRVLHILQLALKKEDFTV